MRAEGRGPTGPRAKGFLESTRISATTRPLKRTCYQPTAILPRMVASCAARHICFYKRALGKLL